MVNVDGNTAASNVAYAFSEVAAIYRSRLPPIWEKMLMLGQQLGKRIYLVNAWKWFNAI